MTDKEIIIDSVDISECEFLWKERLPKKVCNNGNLDCDCNSNPNCYFKQLKRKEQECELLKEDRERWKSNFNGKVSAIEELLQQLDQLKRKEQALDEIEKYLDAQQKYFDGEDYHNLLDIINKVKEEINEKS